MWNWIKEAIAPARCAGCFRYGGWICDQCRSSVVGVKKQRCFKCNKDADLGICNECSSCLDGVVVACEFGDGWIRKAIHQFKYGGNYEVAEVIKDIMIENSNLVIGSRAIVTWVPMYKTKIYSRGYNQARVLATKIAERLDLETSALLKKKLNTVSQVGLDRQQRLVAVQGSIEGLEKLVGDEVILVDDVLTTGATLEECAKVLKNMGAGKVYGFVIARRFEDE